MEVNKKENKQKSETSTEAVGEVRGKEKKTSTKKRATKLPKTEKSEKKGKRKQPKSKNKECEEKISSQSNKGEEDEKLPSNIGKFEKGSSSGTKSVSEEERQETSGEPNSKESHQEAPKNISKGKKNKVKKPIASGNFKGKTDSAEAIAELCALGGFEATGIPLRFYPKNFFESSGLLEEFTKYLSEKVEKGCNLNAEETKVVLKKLKTEEQKPFIGGVVTGVPGCGKSTLIRKIQTEGKLNSVVILGNSRHKVSFSNVPCCYTVKEILLLKVKISFDTLLIDEYTLLSSGEILLLQRIFGAKIVVFFGDRAQGDSKTLSSPEWLQFPTIFASTKSRRFGKKTAEFCGKQGFDFEGSDEHEDDVQDCSYEGNSLVTDINLAFTQATVEDLLECGIECVLVSDVQGKEFDSVTLFVRQEDSEALSDSHLRAVAFTRHRKLLVIRIDRDLLLRLMSGELNTEYNPSTHVYGKRQ